MNCLHTSCICPPLYCLDRFLRRLCWRAPIETISSSRVPGCTHPAFILPHHVGLRSPLGFLYGTPSLRELLVDHDESGILDDHTFFSALVSDGDIVWLSDPTQSGSQSTSCSAGDSHLGNLRPTWLPRDHTSVDLELTLTRGVLPPLALDPGLAGGWNSGRNLQHHLGDDSESEMSRALRPSYDTWAPHITIVPVQVT
ncbi:hypothetical protein RSAG8_09332, partial [Rhizoctonia solani AG-8 WAC10335]